MRPLPAPGLSDPLYTGRSHQVEPVGTQHTLAPEPQFPGLTTIRQKQEEGKDKHSHKNGRKSPLRLLKRGSPTPLPSKSGETSCC